MLARAIVGDPETVRRGLEAKAEATGAEELFVMAVGPDLDSRVRSLELIKGEGGAVTPDLARLDPDTQCLL